MFDCDLNTMKLRVDITHGLQRGRDGRPLVLCSFFCAGDQVSCTNATFLKLARSMGVIGADGRTYFPSDGEAFLRALPNLYHGPHLIASEPIATS